MTLPGLLLLPAVAFAKPLFGEPIAAAGLTTGSPPIPNIWGGRTGPGKRFTAAPITTLLDEWIFDHTSGFFLGRPSRILKDDRGLKGFSGD